MRKASRLRDTHETKISADLCLDGTGTGSISSGVGFFDHMLELFSRHARFDLNFKGQGDLHVDCHHLVEDSGIVLGGLLLEALQDKRGIERYGSFFMPMDETLVRVVLDLSGRSYFSWNVPGYKARVGDMDFEMVREFWLAFCQNAQMNLHIELLYGENLHHISEAIFKGVAHALKNAVSIDPRFDDIPSTKGCL